MAREPHTQLARIQAIILAACSLGGQPHGRGDERVRARGHQRVMETVAKATGLVDRVHGVAGAHFLLDPGDEAGAGKLLGQSDRAAVALDGRDDVAQVHIQPQLEHLAHCGVAAGRGTGKLSAAVKGIELVLFFHMPKREPVLLPRSNPSWHLTRWGTTGSPTNPRSFHTLGPAWLSFCR